MVGEVKGGEESRTEFGATFIVDIEESDFPPFFDESCCESFAEAGLWEC